MLNLNPLWQPSWIAYQHKNKNCIWLSNAIYV